MPNIISTRIQVEYKWWFLHVCTHYAVQTVLCLNCSLFINYTQFYATEFE